MDVRIGFSSSRHPLSRFIQWVLRSPFSHAFLLYEDSVFRIPIVLEAAFSGFHRVPAQAFWRKNQVVHVVVPGHNLSQGLARAGAFLGAHYDVAGLFGIGLTILAWRWFRLKLRNPARGASQLFCSEIIARILFWADFPDAHKLEPDDTDPLELADFLQATPGTSVIRFPATPKAALGLPP